ncbi:hypothetical protein FVE85_4812 [Porphyridium purpureum]|uniref:RNase III domain-containing protein n=1 Tax=Porphyridium purpureum TaxID=35688 RepID=A0A5J4YQZ4_PORPP|nr:hypothetical protein FVE85_4812 [Porphyridium purpureum]|eukprot:POR5825..scf236_6
MRPMVVRRAHNKAVHAGVHSREKERLPFRPATRFLPSRGADDKRSEPDGDFVLEHLRGLKFTAEEASGAPTEVHIPRKLKADVLSKPRMQLEKIMVDTSNVRHANELRDVRTVILQKLLFSGLHKDPQLGYQAKQLYNVLVSLYGYKFRHPGLLALAMIDKNQPHEPRDQQTHSENHAASQTSETHRDWSYSSARKSSRKPRVVSNVPLAFLGDSVLRSVLRAVVLAKSPNAPAQERQRVQTALESNEYLRRVYRCAWHQPSQVFRYNYRLRRLVEDQVAKNAVFPVDAGRTFGTLMEAVVGAVYLDCLDMSSTLAFVETGIYSEELITRLMPELASGADNPVKMLYELAQRLHQPAPVFKLVTRTGQRLVLPSTSEMLKTKELTSAENGDTEQVSTGPTRLLVGNQMTSSLVSSSGQVVTPDADNKLESQLKIGSTSFMVELEFLGMKYHSPRAGSIYDAKAMVAERVLRKNLPAHRALWQTYEI